MRALAGLADDSQVFAVRGPIGVNDVLGHLARCPAREVGSSERAQHRIRGHARPQHQGHLAGARDRQDGRFRELEGAGLGARYARREQPGGLALPGRAIDHRPSIRREAAGQDRSAAKGEALERRRRPLGAFLPGEEGGDGERRRAKEQRRAREPRPPVPPGLVPVGAGARAPADRLEREGEIVSGVKALLGPLLEAVCHDPLQRGRGGGARFGDGRRVVLQDRGHRLGRRCALEGPAAREHLVKHRAQREDVRALVGGQLLHLLGRHVADGSEAMARVGAGRYGGARAPFRTHQLGEPEVEDLDPTVAADEEVLRLDVAMDDALLVRGGQTACDLHGVVQRLARRQSGAAQDRAKRRPLQQLRDQVGGPVLGADVVDGEHVGVIQGAGGAGFLREAAQALFVPGERRRQHLERDLAAQSRVARAVDLAHASRAEGVEHLVRAEPRARGEGHVLRLTKGAASFPPSGPAV